MSKRGSHSVGGDSVLLLRHERGCRGQVGAVEWGALIAQQTKVGRDPLGGVDRAACEAEAPITSRAGSTDVEVRDGGAGGGTRRRR